MGRHGEIVNLNFLIDIKFKCGSYQNRNTLLNVISRLTTSVCQVRAPTKYYIRRNNYYVKCILP